MPTRRNQRADNRLPMTALGPPSAANWWQIRCWASIWVVAAAAASAAAQYSAPSLPGQAAGIADGAVLRPLATETLPPPSEGFSVGRGHRLLVRLPRPSELPDGTVSVEPDVQVIDVPLGFASGDADGPSGSSWGGEGFGEGDPSGPAGAWPYGVHPIPMELPEGVTPTNGFPVCDYDDGCGRYSADAEPLFGEVLANLRRATCSPCGPLGTIFSPANRSGDIGVGRDRLALAPLEMDSSQPSNNILFRVDLAHGFPHPDRSEYFWAKPGKGPGPESGVSYQDFRFRTEVGGENFSVLTEIPIRSLDPIVNANTTGMGDMNVATKTVMLDGKSLQLTQVFRTYIQTGAVKKGLGNGHVSLEPGVLASYQWRPATVLHGELKYWFPLGGDPVHSGQVLRYGLGYSHLLHETDAFALIHTGEFIGFCFLDGGKSVPDPPAASYTEIDVDNELAAQFYPGLRFVADTGGDLGLVEFGFAGTFSMGQNSLFDSFWRFEVRFSR